MILFNLFKIYITIFILIFIHYILSRIIVINEINADASFKLEANELIESKLLSDKHENDFTLDGFYIIVIEHAIGGDRNKNVLVDKINLNIGDKALITTVIPLFNEKFNENRLFTISGTNIENSNIKVPDERIMFRHFYQTKQKANFIPNGNWFPTGIALLYTKNRINLNLDAKRKQIEINLPCKTHLETKLLIWLF